MTAPTEPSSPAARGELPKAYKPADHEPAILSRWLGSGAFHADPRRVLDGSARPYAIVIPPPNVTDRLHLGHALNNTLQDVLARAHRMMGDETLWMPGTDHAGIATQTVVDRRLRAEGKPAIAELKKTPGGREAFVAITQAFKDEYEATITGQLKAIGCSCDWERQRFTMDEPCARAVHVAFFRLFRDGLIYRGKRLVNWDPVTQTALADDEVEMREVDGFFYYLRYPLVHGPSGGEDPQPVTWSELARRGYPGAGEHPPEQEAWITVATTRPETYLGDTAVAVNPRDPRARPLRGLHVELPLVGRIIPIVEDDYVVMPARPRAEGEPGPDEPEDPKARYATGFLKVTPAHDPNDYEIGIRHALRVVNVMAPDASISDAHGWTDVGDAHVLVGKTREAARALVVKEFEARGLFEKKTPYRHSVGHSYRSYAAIEPYLSDQWYVKVTDDRLRGSALRAMAPEQRPVAPDARGTPSASPKDGVLRFHPARYAKAYEHWHENIRDWCISRQLWWGHRIPVWTGPADARARLPRLAEWEARGLAHARSREGVLEIGVVDPLDPEITGALDRAGLTRDPDVLDTWFSSALWPLSTMGWPDDTELLRAFNPTNALSTAREIITLWVSRMVMFNRLFRDGDPPFRDVFIHAVIQDGHGQKMSKSLGNGIDPLDIISTHGADAMRFTLCHMTTQTQDVRMPLELVCPHTGEVFTPAFTTNPAGFVVPEPVQACPKDASKQMVTGYGVASGQARPAPDRPLAKNTSTKFDAGRNFCNKLWNAARFAIGTLEKPAEAARADGLELADRWMLSRLARAIPAIEHALATFQFSEYAERLYDLLWRDFCDWYLEAIKPTIAGNPSQRRVLRGVLDAILRLLHPVLPFITEAIHERLREVPGQPPAGLTLGDSRVGGLLCSAAWPTIDPALVDDEAERDFEAARALVTAIREVRAQHGVAPKRRVTLHAPRAIADRAARAGVIVESMAGLGAIKDGSPAGLAPAFVIDGHECRLADLADAVDAGADRARLEREMSALDKTIATLEGRLANPGYAEKAPPAMVQQTRDQLAKARGQLEVIRSQLTGIA